MPLTSKGSKILAAMSRQYGPKKGKSVFYASINKGKLKGVEGKAEGGRKLDLSLEKLYQKPEGKPHLPPWSEEEGELSPSKEQQRRTYRGPIHGPRIPMKQPTVGVFAEGGKVDEDKLVAGARAIGEQNPAIAAMQRMAARRLKVEGKAKAGGGPTISSDIKMPWAARSATYGLRAARAKGPVIGTTPGRADAKPVSVESGSYVVPADVVSAIGQGNSLAGSKAIGRMFSGSKMQKYGGGKFRMKGVRGLKQGQFAVGGPTKEVPIAISDGEHVISPEEVLTYGNGDMKRGHDQLDKWVLGWRQKHIKQLRRLKPPKKD